MIDFEHLSKSDIEKICFSQCKEIKKLNTEYNQLIKSVEN